MAKEMARRMAHDPPALTNGLEMHLQEVPARSLERRNPASQTIILRLSQCSSTTRRAASPAIFQVYLQVSLPASHFPVKSGQSEGSGIGGRLTGGLPAVRTERALPSGPIRVRKAAQGLLRTRLQAAVIAVSPIVPSELAGTANAQGISPDGVFET